MAGFSDMSGIGHRKPRRRFALASAGREFRGSRPVRMMLDLVAAKRQEIYWTFIGQERLLIC
jgi:hypothetical protein